MQLEKDFDDILTIVFWSIYKMIISKNETDKAAVPKILQNNSNHDKKVREREEEREIEERGGVLRQEEREQKEKEKEEETQEWQKKNEGKVKD